MKKLIIAGAVIAAVSTFAVSAFAANTSSDTAETSGSSAAFCTQTECTQFLCPQDGTGNRYGADNDKSSSESVQCNPSCPQNGLGQGENCKNKNYIDCPNETCTNVCGGAQHRVRAHSKQ